MKQFIKKVLSLNIISYSFWGITSSILNMGVYVLLCMVFDYRTSNLVAIIVCKTYAYIVNKLFVFHSRCTNMKELLQEVVRYILTRGFTGVVDYFGVIIFVEVLNIKKVYSKCFIMLLVLILNYILGKKIVFNKYN